MATPTQQTEIPVGDHIALEIPPPPRSSYDCLVIPLKEKMETITTASSICRVNKKLLEKNEDQYIPQKISIGPFHQGKYNLSAMEEHKWRYLYSLLNRKPRLEATSGMNVQNLRPAGLEAKTLRPSLEATLDICVKTLRELEHKARLFYADHEQIRLSSNEFVELMLVDGGFLIELFLRYAIKGLKRRGDYVFNTSGLLYDLRCDMLLLENQIPYFILQQLFETVPIPEQCKLSLTELAFRFFRNMIPGDHRLHLAKFGQEGNHLLDLIGHCFLPTLPRVKTKQQGQRDLPKATKLKAAGIMLKKAKTADLLDIKFANGVLEIPPIEVHQYTERLFRNLLAFEQSRSESTQHISSYVLLMKSLLRDDRDAKLLKRKQILTNYDVIDKKQVNTLFDRLWDDMNVMENLNFEFYYDGLCEQVKENKRTSWRHLEWNWKPVKPLMKPRFLQQPLPRIVAVIVISFILLILVGALCSIISFFLHKF